MVHVHPSILVIDDHADIRDVLQAFLRIGGYAVDTAENGREALIKLRGGLRPCIILLDLMMPVMDGAEFRQEQLDDPELAGIPVIVFTALDQPVRLVEGLHANAYMQKPVSTDELLALVRKHCLK
jgi:CheY-like chemotaxis protein